MLVQFSPKLVNNSPSLASFGGTGGFWYKLNKAETGDAAASSCSQPPSFSYTRQVAFTGVRLPNQDHDCQTRQELRHLVTDMARMNLEFANFVCRFGNNLVLADQLTEVVLPAFLNDYERSYGDTTYFLHGTEFYSLNDEARHVLAGRIVKDTILVRETLYDSSSGELRPAPKTLPSSPSSFFLLVLETHRLLFVREHRGSPTLKQFETTVGKFLVNAYLEKYGPIRPKVSKEIAYNDGIPAPPSLEIVPMMSADSMDAFLRRFAVVQSLQIRLAETNNEPDNTDFIMQLRESHRKTGSRTTTVNYRNAKGLKITEVQEELSSVADGHGHATVTGKDRAGRNLKGDNEHFGVQVQIDPIPEKVSAAIDQIMGEFDALIDSGTVDPGTVEADTKRKVNKAFNEYR